MVRISDILKKKKTGDTPISSELESTPAQQPISPEESPKEPGEEKPASMQIAKAMKEIQLDTQGSQTIYLQGCQLAKETLDKIGEKNSLDLENLDKTKVFVASIVDALVLGNEGMLNLFYEETKENYLYSHMVNALILSVKIGLGLDYNKSKLNELGMAAFLHDIGMIRVQELALAPRHLSNEEYNQIKKHPSYNVEILSEIKDMPQAIISAVREVHERMNGAGYPQGLKDGQISEYGRIIAAVDVYEALTHGRTHRKKYPPCEAIKEILTTGGALFDPVILRALVKQLGIYPIGSWIELNTNEIGKVIATNDELPLRPVISLIFDSAGNRLDEPRVIDLVKQFNIFIKKPLSDEEVIGKVKEKAG